MTPADRAVRALTRCGGTADFGTLRRLVGRHAVRRARARALILRDSRGRYALPTAHEGRRAANRLTGVVSHTSAAAHWGWPMKLVPEQPTITVPRKRNVSKEARHGVRVSWRGLRPGDVVDGVVTSPLRTVIDCALTLPFDEALVVADSALRAGDVLASELADAAEALRGAGRQTVIRVAREASPLAANPFESVLRAISLDVPGLSLVPQVRISESGLVVRPDLVDEGLRIVAEADSFEWHGQRKALVADCARYCNLVCRGWIVLRFAWEQVMFAPQWVTRCLLAATEQRQSSGQRSRTRAIPA